MNGEVLSGFYVNDHVCVCDTENRWGEVYVYALLIFIEKSFLAKKNSHKE